MAVNSFRETNPILGEFRLTRLRSYHLQFITIMNRSGWNLKFQLRCALIFCWRLSWRVEKLTRSKNVNFSLTFGWASNSWWRLHEIFTFLEPQLWYSRERLHHEKKSIFREKRITPLFWYSGNPEKMRSVRLWRLRRTLGNEFCTDTV